VEVFVHRLGQALSRAGHDVTVLSFSDPPGEAVYRHRPLRPKGFAKSQLARLTTVPIMLNWVDTSGLDLLHVHGDDWFYLRRPIPTVRTFYGYAPYEARYGTRLRLRLRQLLTYPLEAAASRLATTSYAITDGPPPPLYRISGALPLGVAVPAARTPKSETPSVLFVGTWRGRKRGRFLKEVFERHVLEAEPTAELWMVSDRCEVSPHVRWFEAPSDAELTELFSRAWAFCLPSTYEGFGIPYVEAMAAGTAVVATPNPGSRMILKKSGSGLLVADHELGDALVRVLTGRDLRAGLVEAGRRRAGDFEWDRVVEAHESAYRAVLHGRP
jgi:glycosyltransferase involved in cell wall biosynthesis